MFYEFYDMLKLLHQYGLKISQMLSYIKNTNDEFDHLFNEIQTKPIVLSCIHDQLNLNEPTLFDLALKEVVNNSKKLSLNEYISELKKFPLEIAIKVLEKMLLLKGTWTDDPNVSIKLDRDELFQIVYEITGNSDEKFSTFIPLLLRFANGPAAKFKCKNNLEKKLKKSGYKISAKRLLVECENNPSYHYYLKKSKPCISS